MGVRVNYIIQQAKYKLNKLDSKDFDNLPDTVILTAYNEGRLNWLRRNLVGQNIQKIGDDGSKRRLEDFQVILSKPVPLQVVEKDGYYLSQKIFDDFFAFKRLDLKASSDCCKTKMPMIAYLCGEGDIPMHLRSEHKAPSYKWGQTLCTFVDGRMRIYTDGSFKLDTEDVLFMYYRFPATVKKQGVMDLESGTISANDVDCVFKKDLVNLFISEAVTLLANNIEAFNQTQMNQNQVEQNN